MRLGVVPYTNCKPLIYGLDCEIFEAPPAQLPALAGPDDIVLAPIVAAFLDPSLYMLEGVGIGSFGAVNTVKLFFNKTGITIDNLKTVCLDEESKTSVALLKILLLHRYQKVAATYWSNTDCDTSLLIGDKVWKEKERPSLDLGEEWTNWTKLPFVYACWMTKNRSLGEKWKPKLIAQAQTNLKQLNQISTDEHLQRYWKQLNYQLGLREKEGVKLFQKYWAELEKKPVLLLNWI